MIPRERVLTTLSRKTPDKVPKVLHGEIIGYSPSFIKLFREKIGEVNPADHFQFEIRSVNFKPTCKKADFLRYLPGLPREATIDEWGVGHILGSLYRDDLNRMVHPMRQFRHIREIEDYPFPDLLSEYRYKDIEKEILAIKQSGLAVTGFGGMIFETSWYLRGLENLLIDFQVNENFAEVLLDRVTEIVSDVSCRFAKGGIDILILGDDIGTQKGLMMSPDMWRRWLKPRLAKVIRDVRNINSDIYIFYHSDGDVRMIIPELIEIGIDILNPVQPECMDPTEIKQLYGDKLAFWGTISIQKTMSFGTPEEVRREVKERIETIGRGGGLVISPTHMLGPEVPWENIIAFFEAVEEFGKY